MEFSFIVCQIWKEKSQNKNFDINI